VKLGTLKQALSLNIRTLLALMIGIGSPVHEAIISENLSDGHKDVNGTLNSRCNTRLC